MKKINIERMENFIKGLTPEERKIATKYVELPNTADIGPEVLSLEAQYGEQLTIVSDKIEAFRNEISCNYKDIQQPLKDILSKYF